jgi:alkylhydroperoxidase family enzyme
VGVPERHVCGWPSVAHTGGEFLLVEQRPRAQSRGTVTTLPRGHGYIFTENLSAAERAALNFAELFATDHLAIDDAVYDELREHFSKDELVELGLHCAIALGIGRLSATWDVSDDLPEPTASSGQLAPWNSASVVASG